MYFLLVLEERRRADDNLMLPDLFSQKRGFKTGGGRKDDLLRRESVEIAFFYYKIVLFTRAPMRDNLIQYLLYPTPLAHYLTLSHNRDAFATHLSATPRTRKPAAAPDTAWRTWWASRVTAISAGEKPHRPLPPPPPHFPRLLQHPPRLSHIHHRPSLLLLQLMLG